MKNNNNHLQVLGICKLRHSLVLQLPNNREDEPPLVRPVDCRANFQLLLPEIQAEMKAG